MQKEGKHGRKSRPTRCVIAPGELANLGRRIGEGKLKRRQLIVDRSLVLFGALRGVQGGRASEWLCGCRLELAIRPMCVYFCHGVI